MNHKVMLQLQRLSTYLPLVGTAIILLVSTFYSAVLDVIPLPLLLAIMAASFLLTAVHLESHLYGTSEAVRALGSQVSSLEETQQESLRLQVPTIQTVSLGRGFEIASSAVAHVGHLRVFAVSSQQILGFIRFHSFTIESCSLLVRGFAEDDQTHQAIRTQIELVVQDWRSLQKEGRIGKLSVRSYDFLPTEYECIFDDKFMLLGLYDSDPQDYSGVRVRKATLIESSTLPGSSMVEEYIERFDGLFLTCASHHGPDSYNTGKQIL